MYIEFIIIFICLGVIIALLIPILVMLSLLWRERDEKTPVYNRNNFMKDEKESKQKKNNTQPAIGKVVFCRQCAAEFDASQKVCPECGTKR